MNFLAHIALSGPEPEIQIGNFLGDFVRGTIEHPRNAFLSPTMKVGAKLHRLIDSFTDSHPVVRQSIDRLQPRYHKYAGIVVDVYYDHFLAKSWQQFGTDEPLEEYARHFYAILHQAQPSLPRSFDNLIKSISTQDWLSNYAHLDGIEWALKGISRRTEHVSGIENAIEELRDNFELFEQEFLVFYPQVRQMCQTFINEVM